MLCSVPARPRFRQVPPAPHCAFAPQAAFGVGPAKHLPGLTQPRAPLSALAGEAFAT